MAVCHQVVQETGLPLAPVRALLVLPLDEALSMRQLARRLGCDNSYVTPLVDARPARRRPARRACNTPSAPPLVAARERGALAAPQPHPTDRRIKVIVL